RRAMGKKIQEAMDAEKPKFLAGAAENGVDKAKAEETWALLDKFANYGFNKSHAAAYAVVSYQTAWLKANHPVEFMAGVMNCDLHLTDKLAAYFHEAKKTLGLRYTPPCVNRSEATFTVRNGALVYALGALKNVGVDAMRLITEGRRGAQPAPGSMGSAGAALAQGRDPSGEDRPFATLYDFARRVDLKRVSKRPLEMLARAGAFDELDRNRRRVFESIDALISYSAAIFEQKTSNQVSLFGEAGDDLPEPRLAQFDDWLPGERLNEEFAAIGFYLSGHPLDDYLPALRRTGVLTLDEITAKAAPSGGMIAKMAGTVSGRQERKSARGNRFAFVQLSDPTGAYEVTMFSEALEAAREHLESGTKIEMQVEASMEADQLKLLGRAVRPLDAAVAQAGAAGFKIFLEDGEAVPSVASVFEGLKADAGRGAKGAIRFCLLDPGLPGEVELELEGKFPVSPQVKSALKSLPGVLSVEEL
ncbi:MAG: OB-fold nucleic acid binding domain-containing protein, partial [Pseudomonadota bacterium]